LPSAMSYNRWLRDQSLTSRDTLVRATENLLELVQVLHLALQSETTMAPLRVLRITSAVNHLVAEIHLSDIGREID